MGRVVSHCYAWQPPGRLAQLGERRLDKAEVTGSSPVSPTERSAVLGRELSFGQHVRRPKPDEQLTLGGIARPELLGSVLSHVTLADPGRDPAQLVQVGTQLDRALDHD